MNCERCLNRVKFKDIFFNDDHAILCETCFMLLDEAKDKELIELQRIYHKELTE